MMNSRPHARNAKVPEEEGAGAVGPDVVDGQQLVVDETLDEVEQAPPEDGRPEQRPARGGNVGRSPRPPQQHDSDDSRDVRHSVEDAIQQDVQPQASHSRGIGDSRGHVVLLEDLM